MNDSLEQLTVLPLLVIVNSIEFVEFVYEEVTRIQFRIPERLKVRFNKDSCITKSNSFSLSAYVVTPFGFT